MNVTIWTYSESERAANEVARAGEEVAKSVGGESVTLEMNSPRARIQAAVRKLVLKSAAPLDSPEAVSEAISRAAKKSSPSAVLVGATRDGREIAARLAAKLGTGCISEVQKLAISNNLLTGERAVYSARVAASVGVPMPGVATVKLGAYEPLENGAQSTEEMEVGEVQRQVRVLQRNRKEAGKVDLKSAKTIVSAGRGLKKKEDLAMLEDLARLLGGALGCSRPLSSDLGWLPEEHHIGLTGISVNPELYLAVGISGQLQHIAGIKDSKIIAAINSDKDAPIFQASDYGIVGDLYQVVPALQRRLGGRRP